MRRHTKRELFPAVHGISSRSTTHQPRPEGVEVPVCQESRRVPVVLRTAKPGREGYEPRKTGCQYNVQAAENRVAPVSTGHALMIVLLRKLGTNTSRGLWTTKYTSVGEAGLLMLM